MTNKLFITTVFWLSLFVTATAGANHERIVVPYPTKGDSHRNDRPQHDDDRGRYERPDRRSYGGHVTPYLAVGMGSGGDVVGRFSDNFGDVEKVRGGGGLFVEGGVLMALDPTLRLRLTAGYEWDAVVRLNGDSAFDRVRFDGMLLQNFGAHEFGLGLTAHTGVSYDCDINSLCAGDVDFDNALGYTLEYAVTTAALSGGLYNRRVNPLRDARLGIRFTDIEYRPKFVTDNPVGQRLIDGQSLSLFFGFSW